MNSDLGAMAKFIETIRRIAVQTVNSMNLTKAVIGTVQSIEPLMVFIDAKLTLPAECLIVPAYLKPIEAYTEGEYPVKVKIDNVLKSGDKVILLRMQGGQKFVIMGVVS